MPDQIQVQSSANQQNTSAGGDLQQTAPDTNPSQPQPASRHIEQEPVRRETPQSALSEKIDEYIKPSLPEINIPGELNNIMEKSPETEPAKAVNSAPPDTVPLPKQEISAISTQYGMINLPMNYNQAKQKIKETKFDDSMHWLSALIMYQWLKYEPDAAKESK